MNRIENSSTKSEIKTPVNQKKITGFFGISPIKTKTKDLSESTEMVDQSVVSSSPPPKTTCLKRPVAENSLPKFLKVRFDVNPVREGSKN